MIEIMCYKGTHYIYYTGHEGGGTVAVLEGLMILMQELFCLASSLCRKVIDIPG